MTYKRVTLKQCRACGQRLPIGQYKNSYSKLCFNCVQHRLIEKPCSQCKKTLPLESFAKSGSGHQGYCKTCQTKNGPKYAASRDPEKLKAKSKREWDQRKNDPIYHAKQREWRTKNQDKIKAGQKEWYEKNKQYRHSFTNNTRAKSLGVPGYVRFEDWKFVINLADSKCLACEEYTEYFVMDHVVPMTSGGLNLIENVQPLCARCNLKKGSKVDLDFRNREFIEAIRKNCTLGLMAKE